jgi:hypothetical protein
VVGILGLLKIRSPPLQHLPVIGVHFQRRISIIYISVDNVKMEGLLVKVHKLLSKKRSRMGIRTRVVADKTRLEASFLEKHAGPLAVALIVAAVSVTMTALFRKLVP